MSKLLFHFSLLQRRMKFLFFWSLNRDLVSQTPSAVDNVLFIGVNLILAALLHYNVYGHTVKVYRKVDERVAKRIPLICFLINVFLPIKLCVYVVQCLLFELSYYKYQTFITDTDYFSDSGYRVITTVFKTVVASRF